MVANLPTLRILATESLVPHEWHDDSRAKPLVERLRASGVLRNPPIVMPFDDASGRYMVLDGANRSSAFRQMGLPHLLAQVVEENDPGLELMKWNHVLWNGGPGDLLDSIASLDDISFESIDPQVKRPQSEWPEKTLVWMQTPDGEAYIARTEETDIFTRTQQLARIAHLYTDKFHLDRTTAQRIEELNGQYENLRAIVVYPPFKVHQVLELCEAGILLPPGVTRFTMSPRALRVNYPLEELSANKSLADKNAALDRWVNERVARKGVRFYAESTVLFDE
jgi:hypothetical protein